MSSQTSSSWALPAALTHPKSTDAAFIGHTFKWAAHSWQIHQKTANKRGPVSWVWYHGSELWEAKGPISKKAHWLCQLDSSVYDWWKTQDHIPSVRKMAYDHLCVPAMSSETERCFRGTKLGISETRKRLDWAVIEATEVSRGLMKYGVL
jgi:hypothetical protein